MQDTNTLLLCWMFILDKVSDLHDVNMGTSISKNKTLPTVYLYIHALSLYPSSYETECSPTAQ